MKGDGLTAHGFMLEVHVKSETKIDELYLMQHDVIDFLVHLPLMTASTKCSGNLVGRENAS